MTRASIFSGGSHGQRQVFMDEEGEIIDILTSPIVVLDPEVIFNDAAYT